MKQLTSEVRAVHSLSSQEVRNLFAIFLRCYDAVSLEQFTSDLTAKDDVLLLRDASGNLQGFSTQVTHRYEIEGRTVRVLFSGDTIISPECWGTQELVRAWCRYAGAVKAAQPGDSLYWLLLSKGHRTYLYLPLFFLEYHPHVRGDATALHVLKDAIASRMFGEDYKSKTGRLEFSSSKGHLREPLAEVPSGRDRNEHIAFFLQRNPGYVEGHELVCLAEISPENMRGSARRHLEEGMQSRGITTESPAQHTWLPDGAALC